MTDFNANEKPYTHLRDQDAERKAIMQSLIGVIRNCSLLGFYSVVRLEEFERFCADKCVLIDPYAFNLYVCKVMMAREWPDARIELKLDRVPKPNNKIALSDFYMDSDPLHAGGGKRISVEALAECDTFREITPIESADFLAWESRKEAIHKDGWNAGGSDWAALPEYKKSLESWAAGNGRKYPFERKSFGALIEEGVIGKTWGYPELETSITLGADVGPFWRNDFLECPLQILRIVGGAVFSGGFPYPLGAFFIGQDGLFSGHGRIVPPRNGRCEMKYRRKDGTPTKGSDWDEMCFSAWEVLALAILAGVGLIAILNYAYH